MTVDPDLEVWREQWLGEDAIPAGLRSKVERQSLMIRIALIVDCLVTIAMGGWTTIWAILSHRSSVWLLAAATWTFLVAAWIFVILNMRGAWTPHEATVAEFAAISVRRRRARLRAAVFGGILCVAEVGFCLRWLSWNYGVRDPLTVGSVCAGTAVLVGLCVWYYRRQKQQLNRVNLRPRQFKALASQACLKIAQRFLVRANRSW